MRWIWVLIFLVVGCTHTTKTSVSVYLEKDLWVEAELGSKPDARARLEYKLEQDGPWLPPQNQHE